MPRKRPGLKLAVTKPLVHTSSFRASPGKFETGDVKIDGEGVTITDKAQKFQGVRYEDLIMGRMLGRGASSTVKFATHASSGERYAVKCINMYDKSKRGQLVSELHTLYVSDCAAMVQFYGATFHEGEVAVTLEFMDIGGLDSLLKKTGPVPEPVLACIAFQVLWGLAYLQHEKRVHRDIKPPNILINSKGEVKLTDFGISKQLQNSLMCATFVGSFKYMAPERMLHSKYDYSADIWSLGIVLMELALGKYPYPQSSSAIGYVHIVTEGDAPTLPEGKFSEEFEVFISRMASKDKDHRLPADVLLGAPWMLKNGAENLDACAAIVRKWLRETGVVNEEGEVVSGGGDEEESKDGAGEESKK